MGHSDNHELPEGYNGVPCPEDERLVCLVARNYAANEEAGYYVRGRDKLYLLRDLYGRLPEIQIPGLEAVDLIRELHKRVWEDARERRQQFMREHRDGDEIYRCSEFWQEALQELEEDMVRPRVFYTYTTLSRRARITFSCGCKVHYDPITEAITYEAYGEYDHKPSAFEALYGKNLCRQMLAKEQLRKGCAHPAYAELGRIADFLRRKPTVRLHYPDRVVPTPRRRKVKGIASVFRFGSWKLGVNSELFPLCYDLPLAITYGQERLDLDLETLGQIPVLLGEERERYERVMSQMRLR